MGSDEYITLLIAGQDPPSWLSAALEKARATLAWTIKKERRKEMRRRLVKLAGTIGTVREAMRDFDLATLLRAGDSFFVNENETYQGLGDLAQRVSKTLVALPARQGRHKYFWRVRGATPQQVCALMINVLWQAVQSAAPPNTNTNAQEACAALWTASGGPTKLKRKSGARVKIASDSTEVWRDHLRAAKRFANSEDENLLKRSLVPGWPVTLASPHEADLIRRLGG
jgi:hypothetical protein